MCLSVGGGVMCCRINGNLMECVMRFCCSMLFIFGVNVVMLSILFVYGVDVVIFDLEDVVVLCEKDIVCFLVYYVF